MSYFMTDQRRNVAARANRRESKKYGIVIAIVFVIILCSGSIESIPM